MTRLSTGYTFLNIQEHSKFIRKNLDNVHKLKPKIIPDKYQFLDKIFLKVLANNPKKCQIYFIKCSVQKIHLSLIFYLTKVIY